MKEFTIADFTQSLRDLMYNRFPYESDELAKGKHKKRPLHIRDVAFKNNQTIVVNESQLTFDIGNEFSEENYPYYHIIEDSPYIHKKDRGTSKSRGSQAKVEKLSDRNYSFPTWNGKTFTQEYRKNVRGKRSRADKVSHWGVDSSGNRIWINRESNEYLNIHYNYIEKMLNNGILDQLALEYGLKRKRTEKTGLEEELAMEWDEDVSVVLDAFQSFE